MDESFVVVYRSHDPLQTEMLTELLQQQGFDARHIGSRHAASFGAGQVAFEQRIEVPPHQAESAEEVIRVAVDADALTEETRITSDMPSSETNTS